MLIATRHASLSQRIPRCRAVSRQIYDVASALHPRCIHVASALHPPMLPRCAHAASALSNAPLSQNRGMILSHSMHFARARVAEHRSGVASKLHPRCVRLRASRGILHQHGDRLHTLAGQSSPYTQWQPVLEKIQITDVDLQTRAQRHGRMEMRVQTQYPRLGWRISNPFASRDGAKLA